MSSLSADDINRYIQFYLTYRPPQYSDHNDEFHVAQSSATLYADDPHAVSIDEATFYYADLISGPTLLYRTGEPWYPPMGPETYYRKKKLIPAFGGQLEQLWNKGCLSWDVAKSLDEHKVFFTSLNVVRFKMLEVEVPDCEPRAWKDSDGLSPLTIYIGVLPGSTAPTAAHNATKDIQALLLECGITETVNIEFAEFYVRRQSGPQLLKNDSFYNPLADVMGPLTSALGLPISTEARPDAQGTMAIYLAEGGDSDRLLGLACRHVIFDPTVANENYEHPSGEHKEKVQLLGQRGFTRLVDSIKAKIGDHGIMLRHYEDLVERYDTREKGDDPEAAAMARTKRPEKEALIHETKDKMNALESFRIQVERDWSDSNSRELGHVLRSPPLTLGFDDEYRFTEDWAILELDRAKLGADFVGNKLDIGAKIRFVEFTVKLSTHPDDNWSFEYPIDDVLPLQGVITEELMRAPDMRDRAGEPCLFVVKNGNTTGTTIGRANGFSAANRIYKPNSTIVEGTSREWAVFNYDNESGAFSEPGDSGSIVVDSRGRIGGILTSGGGRKERPDMTFVTPWWWIIKRVKKNGFPNVHLDVVKGQLDIDDDLKDS